MHARLQPCPSREARAVRCSALSKAHGATATSRSPATSNGSASLPDRKTGVISDMQRGMKNTRARSRSPLLGRTTARVFGVADRVDTADEGLQRSQSVRINRTDATFASDTEGHLRWIPARAPHAPCRTTLVSRTAPATGSPTFLASNAMTPPRADAARNLTAIPCSLYADFRIALFRARTPHAAHALIGLCLIEHSDQPHGRSIIEVKALMQESAFTHSRR